MNQQTVDEFLSKQIQSTSDTSNMFKLALQNTLKQIEEGYRSTMLMYKVSFYMGVGLIVASLLFGIFADKVLFSVAFGGLGMLDFIFFFITKPPKDLQESRAKMAQLQANFFSWYTDIYNWNSYLLKLGETDQIDFDTMKKVSDAVIENTRKVMGIMNSDGMKFDSSNDQPSAAPGAKLN